MKKIFNSTRKNLRCLLACSGLSSGVLCMVSCAGSHDVWLVRQGQPHAEVGTRSISKEAFFGHASNTYIRKVNGVGMENPAAVYRVAPGNVRLAVENRYETFSAQGEILFRARAGHRYAVKSDQAVGMKVKFWVEDLAGNTEVAAAFAPLDISDEKRPKPPLVMPIFIPVN